MSESIEKDVPIRSGLHPCSPVKRLLAGLFDMVLLFFIHYGLYSLVLLTPIAEPMHNYWESMKVRQDNLKLETGYGAKSYFDDPSVRDEKYPNHHLYEETEGGMTRYYVVENIAFPTEAERKTAYDKWVAAVNDDAEYQDHSMRYHLHNFVITCVLVGGVLELIWFFIVPLPKQLGGTPGMLLCGIRLISVGSYGKPHWYQHLGRFLFIWVIESCLPYFFLAQWTLLAVPAALILILLATPRKRTLHDLVSGVMAIDKDHFHDYEEDLDAITKG